MAAKTSAGERAWGGTGSFYLYCAAMSRPGFARSLLAWYDREKRDLPWRRAVSAYRTLVSELMLQQTVVATVIPYFERFVVKFPDIGALALAKEEDVLAAWSGLGYYRRARHLHRAAKVVMEEHGGRLPLDEETLRSLPGVGEYTAAAVAAIAGGRRTFALDGNAARVMARLSAFEAAIDTPAARKELRAFGTTLVPEERCGDFAQAVMELGATVCTPASPKCLLCPVRAWCAVQKTGRQAEIPPPRVRAAKKPLLLACAAVERGGKVLLVRRREGLLASTLFLPSVECAPGEPSVAAAARALADTGLEPSGEGEPLGRVRHVFTHRDATAEVVRLAVRGRLREADAVWVAPGELGDVPLSSFARKLIALVTPGAARPRRGSRPPGHGARA